MSQITNVEFKRDKTEECDGNVVFSLNGVDHGTGYEFENDKYYYTHDGRILFDDGTPFECESDYQFVAIMNVLRENNIVE